MTISANSIEHTWPITEVKLDRVLRTTGGSREVSLVRANEGLFIYKIADEWKTADALTRDLRAFELLPEKGFEHIPELVKTKTKDSYAEINGQYVYLLEYVSGHSPEPTAETYEKLGLITAELHLVEQYPYETEFHPEPIINNNLKTTGQNLPFSKEYLSIVEELPTFRDLPQSMIHTDISPGNTIETTEGEFVLIDWDEAGMGMRVLDVAFPLIQQFVSEDCYLNTKNAGAFYEAYFSKVSLTRREIEHVFPAALFIALMYIIYGDTNKRWDRIQWSLRNRSVLESVYRG